MGRLLTVALLASAAVYVPRQSQGQQLVVAVDRGSGEVSLSNSSAASGHVAVYNLSSEFGVLDPSGYAPLADADASWRVLGSPSANELAEVKETGALQVEAGSRVSLGIAFDLLPAKLAAGFGVDVEDLQVSLYDPVLDQVTTPGVVYVGEKVFNNLVLNIDLASGAATIENESPFSVGLTGYTVGSAAGALDPDWAGLRSLDDAAWDEAGISSATAVAELNADPTTSALALASDAKASLGRLYAGGAQDVTFEFTLQGLELPLLGEVKYVVSPVDVEPDGDVDGADFLELQRSGGSLTTAWGAAFGDGVVAGTSVAAVPEPNSVTICIVLSLSAMVIPRRGRR